MNLELHNIKRAREIAREDPSLIYLAALAKGES